MENAIIHHSTKSRRANIRYSSYSQTRSQSYYHYVIKNSRTPLIIELLSRLDSMSNRKEILICWIPSHIEVRRNERADSATRSALCVTPDKFRIPYTDWKIKINQFTQNGNGAGIITSITDSSRSSPHWEDGDQLSENEEENTSLCPNCVLVIQGSLTLSYWNKNNNHNV